MPKDIVFVAVSVEAGLDVVIAKSKRMLSDKIGINHTSLQRDLSKWEVVKGWHIKETQILKRPRGRSL